MLDRFIKYGDMEYKVKGLCKFVTEDKSHGCRERREYYFIAAPRDARPLRRWSGLRSIGMIYRRRENGGAIQEEAVFVTSSHRPEVKNWPA